MTTGERIRYYRERAGLTMEQLAKKIGVQNSAINKYEKGIVTNIPLERIKLIAQALDVAPEQLVEWGGEVDVYKYRAELNRLLVRRQSLMKFIEDAPEETLDVIEMLLKLPPQQLQALATLTGLTTQRKDS